MKETTLLLRQIHPNFIQADRVTSQAFRPTSKDEQHVSMYDGDQIGPQPAFEYYTEGGNHSIGVMAVNMAECSELEMSVRPDPELLPEHVMIDFSDFTKKVTEKKAKLLKARAE